MVLPGESTPIENEMLRMVLASTPIANEMLGHICKSANVNPIKLFPITNIFPK